MSEATPVNPPASESLKLVVLDQSKDARDAARDRADERLVEELNEGGGVKRFVNGIWKGNVAKEFYRQRYIQDALGDIEQSQNVLTHETGLSVESRGRAINATIERFQTEHDEVIHTDAGEKREVLDADSEIATTFKSLIRRYAQGDLNDTTLREERTRFMQAYRENHDEAAFGEGLVTTDNMTEIARAVMGAVEHGESLDHVIANMQVVTGEARGGVRTEAQYNKVDAVIDRLSKSKVGSMVGPEIVVSAVTLAAVAAKWGSQSVLSATLKTIAPGAGAGVWAGLRENKRMKDERSQHARERAQGKEFGEDATRRNELEETRYESVSAQYLTDSVREFSATERLDEGDEALRAALDALAQVQSRIDLSNKRNIDLISYSDAAAVGDERMALDVARAEARVALEQRLTPEARAALGLDDESTVRDIVGQRSLEYIELIDEDISAKDRAFKALKAKRVAKAAAIGVATGLVGGVIAQELLAAADPMRAGLFEKAWGAENTISADGMQHQTLLEGIAEGGDRVLHTDASDVHQDYATTAENDLGSLSLSNDHAMVENGDGTVNFVDPNGHVTVENLVINPDGSLPQESLDQLDAAGMAVEDHSFDQDVTVTETVQVNGDQYVQNHLAETTSVTRDFWYGNDTPGIYDQNELRVFWGGNNGLVDGGYQLSAAGMTANGSWQGGETVDWNQASANGNLFMSISATVDTQTQTFMVPIGPDGAINIAADSPAGQFFANENGRATFTGAYAEVVQTAGVDENGVLHMRPLATLVGSGGDGPIADTITTTTTEHHSVYTVTTEGYDTTVQNFTEAAPVLPIESRRSLEKPLSRRVAYYNGAERLTPAERAQRRRETSPRMLEDPNADLVPEQELKWYRKALEKSRGREYVEQIDAVVRNTPELATIDKETKVILQVPVNAAGEAESKGIYTLLTEGYGKQDASALDQSVILLHVNWFDSYEGDDAQVRENIARTRSEVARAKADRPDMRIAVIETQWTRSEVQGGVIGHVSRKMHDAALLALDTAHSEGRLASTDDALLIRNDSDPKGLSPNYLKNYVRSFTEDGEVDIFTGVTTFDNTKASRLPGLVFAGNFMQSLELLNASRHGAVHTGGANFGIRASTFAAIGGTGFDENNSGAGTDDVVIGRRVKAAREGSYAVSRGAVRAYALGGYVGSSTAGGTKSRRRIAKKISARIDTDSDRQEDLYLRGIPIIDSWNPENNFDKNGYQARDAGLGAAVTKESLLSDPDVVIERVRRDMQRSIEAFRDSPAVVESALQFAFMGVGSSGYKLTQKNGKTVLTFTEAGVQYLRNHLTRDIKGRFDSYGARKQRQLYGRVKPGAARQSDRQSLISI